MYHQTYLCLQKPNTMSLHQSLALNLLGFFILFYWIQSSLAISIPKISNGKRFGEIGEYIQIDDMILPKAPGNGKAGMSNFNWPDGIIPYVIDVSIFEHPGMLSNVMGAMSDISEKTCIKFRPAETDVDTYWAKFWVNPSESQCSSIIGWRNIPNQEINLNTGCPRGAITHETLHSLGFLHEQTRNDRDDYVKIKLENMIEPDKYAHNFVKDEVLGYETSYHGVPYNYGSIMHYLPSAFSVNTSDPNKNTIVSLDNPKAIGDPKTMGQLLKLTDGDVQMINNKYGCSMIPVIGTTDRVTKNTKVTEESTTAEIEDADEELQEVTEAIQESSEMSSATRMTTQSMTSGPQTNKPPLNPLCTLPLKPIPPFCYKESVTTNY